MQKIIKSLNQWGYNICSVYTTDSCFLDEPHKYISNNLVSLATMMQLGLPHVNVLTKCDKLHDKQKLIEFLDEDNGAELLLTKM